MNSNLYKTKQLIGLAEEFAMKAARLDSKCNLYEPYLSVLQKATKLGYNSSIVCPVMAGCPKEWAMFFACLVNEITDFTQIVKTPACLISGGPLNNSKSKNEEFAYYFFANVRPTKNITFLYCSSGGKAFKLQKPKNILDTCDSNELISFEAFLQQIEALQINLSSKKANALEFEFRAFLID